MFFFADIHSDRVNLLRSLALRITQTSPYIFQPANLDLRPTSKPYPCTPPLPLLHT